MANPRVRWTMGVSTIFRGKGAVNSPTACTSGSASLRGGWASTSLRSQTLTVVRVEVYPHSVNSAETSHLCAPPVGDSCSISRVSASSSSLHLWLLGTSSSRGCEVIRLNRPNLDQHERKAHIRASKADVVAKDDHSPVELCYAALIISRCMRMHLCSVYRKRTA